MRRQLLPAFVMMVVFTVITGLAYPLVVTGIAQGCSTTRPTGRWSRRDGEVVGSRCIGQAFSEPRVLPPPPVGGRATATTPASARGSNLGPTNPKLLVGDEDDPATDDVDETFDGVERAGRRLP